MFLSLKKWFFDWFSMFMNLIFILFVKECLLNNRKMERGLYISWLNRRFLFYTFNCELKKWSLIKLFKFADFLEFKKLFIKN